MNTGIYQIRNRANGKVYIGSAVNLAERFYGHRGGLNRGEHHNAHLQSAWRKYGAEAFEFRPLLLCARGDLFFYEQRCIERFDAVVSGYNKSPNAGTCLGIKRTPEYIARMAAGKRGTKRSAATRAKHSATCLRPEVRALLSAAGKLNRGIPKAPAHIKKVADANMGKVISPETKAKLRAFNLGLKHGPHSEETRHKISMAQKGRPLTDEHRAALSVAQRRRFERERMAGCL